MTFQQQLWYSRGQSDASTLNLFWAGKWRLIGRYYKWYAKGYNDQIGAWLK
jgi:hypothetical protein